MKEAWTLEVILAVNFKRRLEAEKIVNFLYTIDFLNFCLSEFYFQSEFLFDLIFRCIKPI